MPTPNDGSKDLALLESIYTIPAKANQSLGLCEKLRQPLASNPRSFQKLNYFWGTALAGTSKRELIPMAQEKFTLASSPTTPDQALAILATRGYIELLLSSPDELDKALTLIEKALPHTSETSQDRVALMVQKATVCALKAQTDKALDVLDHCNSDFEPPSPILSKKLSYLAELLVISKSAQDSKTPPHVFYAPWRPMEPLNVYGIRRRMGDIAMAYRDFARARAIYTALEPEAQRASQTEIYAWCSMQLSRLDYIQFQDDRNVIKKAVSELRKFRLFVVSA